MLFDTDVVIWALRGNAKAAKVIDNEADRRISAVTYMELLKGSRDKREQRAIKTFVHDLAFEFLPVDANTSHRAVVYVEEFALSAAMDIPDALIAATATEHGIPLCTANKRHYKVIPDLEIRVFRP